jgi:hypothetical protein
MIELMTTASQEIAGTLLLPNYLTRTVLFDNYLLYCFPFGTGSPLDAATEEERVNQRVGFLMRLAAEVNVDSWADETRCHAIVQFQDRAAQACEFIDFYRSSAGMVYNSMFPLNPQPEKCTD